MCTSLGDNLRRKPVPYVGRCCVWFFGVIARRYHAKYPFFVRRDEPYRANWAAGVWTMLNAKRKHSLLVHSSRTSVVQLKDLRRNSAKHVSARADGPVDVSGSKCRVVFREKTVAVSENMKQTDTILRQKTTRLLVEKFVSFKSSKPFRFGYFVQRQSRKYKHRLVVRKIKQFHSRRHSTQLSYGSIPLSTER